MASTRNAAAVPPPPRNARKWRPTAAPPTTRATTAARTTSRRRAAARSLTSLTALKGRKITLSEILSSLDQVKHWPAPGQDEGRAAVHVRGRGEPAVGGERHARQQPGRTTTDVRAQQDEDIRRTAARAASIHSKRSSIQQETGTASRVAAASEAVMRAHERTKAYEERSRRLSAGSSVCSSGSAGSGPFATACNIAARPPRASRAPLLALLVEARPPTHRGRSAAARRSARRGAMRSALRHAADTACSAPRSGGSSSPERARSERDIRPRNRSAWIRCLCLAVCRPP